MKGEELLDLLIDYNFQNRALLHGIAVVVNLENIPRPGLLDGGVTIQNTWT
jgi:hypothetical protein